MKAFLIAAALGVGVLSWMSAADADRPFDTGNDGAVWIDNLKCSDLIDAHGSVDPGQVRRFNSWLVGFLMGASTAGLIDITRHISISDAGAAVLTECQKRPSDTVVSASVDTLEFFTNLLGVGRKGFPVELPDPSPAR